MRRILVFALAWACLAAPLRSAPLDAQEGRLRILLNGQPVGEERYRITRTATEIQTRSDVEFTVGDRKVRESSSLLLGADLAPRHYEWKMEEPKGAWLRLQFEGTVGTIRYPLPDGKQDEQVFDFATTRLALLDNNVFHHFLLLAALYDFQAGGVQTIKVFVPQAVQPGEAQVELKGVETLPVDGRPQPVRHLLVTTADNRIELWLTESGRFVRLQAPLANVEVVPVAAAP